MIHAWIGVPDHEGHFIPQGRHGRFSDPSYQVTLTTDPCRPEGRGPSGVAYRENRAVVINDIDCDERLAPWLGQAKRDGVKSLAAYPIVRGGKPHAIFSVYSDQAGIFDHEIASLLESMAKNLGFALDNFDRDAMRRESEERFRQLANAMPQLVWVAEPDGAVNYCNARQQEYAGLNRMQSGHFEWTPALHPEDVEFTVSSWHRALETGGKFEAEHRLQRKDGNCRWHISRGFPAHDEQGRITKWFGTSTDIHELKMAQDAARRSEEILRLAQQAARIGSFDWNIRTNVIESFLESEPLYGLSPGSFGGAAYEQWLEFLHPEDRAAAERDIREALASGRLQAEWRIVRTDGKVRWLAARARVFKDDAGQPLRMVGINMDVTDQKRVEEENTQLSFQRKLALDAARLGWWHHDFASKKTNYDRRYREIFGFGQDEPSFKDVHARIHPDDRAAFLEKINAAIDPGNPQAYENEYRIIRHDGSMRWLEAHGMVSFQGQEAERRAASFVGAVADITERKEAEERLKLAAMVYQDGSEGMIIADADNRIIAVNPAFERITGHLAKDVIGEHMRLLFADPKNNSLYKPVGKALRTRGSWKGDLWSRRKNGRRFAAAVTINTSFDPNGSVDKRVILFSDITKKKESDELIWSQANFDALTGLPNRRMFRDRLEHDVRSARRNRSPLALMFLDLDGFKHVNDTLGHDMGDVLLQEAARRLKACVREADTVARLGGDEFTVVLTELHSMDNAQRVACHILETLSGPIRLGEELAYVSASIGITFFPDDAVEVDDLIRNADMAMYSAKEEGKNQYRYFTPAMQEAAARRMRVVSDMRSALDASQIELVYQPIVNLSTGRIQKAEALIRWQHPEKGLISPIDFISVAEDSGMISPFGNWVFREAARQAVIWRENHHPGFQISVNISPAQFRNGGLDPAAWIRHLNDISLPGRGIVVEITEGLLLDADSTVSDHLLALKNSGMEISLDDFGTGYSSLARLKRLDIDYIKIDREFVRNITSDPGDLTLCEAIIMMARKLNIRVIAEGIETRRQHELLANAECDFGQGYFFSKPVSAAELEQLLQAAPFSSQAFLHI